MSLRGSGWYDTKAKSNAGDSATDREPGITVGLSTDVSMPLESIE
jgi:hypothetical protein